MGIFVYIFEADLPPDDSVNAVAELRSVDIMHLVIS